MSANNQLYAKTPFGLKGGRMLAPVDVESGLSCGCTCPGCDARLVAKLGEKNAWHFAHHNVTPIQSCLETAIHAAAKQVLLDENWFQVPGNYISVSGRTKYGAIHTKNQVLRSERAIRFDYSRDEVWETNLRPDVVGYRGNLRILVEMFFTHKVDEAKRHKLDALHLHAIEIDLSNLASDSGFEEVRQRVLHDIVEKEWLFYPGEKEAREALNITLDEEIAQLNLAHDLRLAKQQREEHRQLAERQITDELQQRKKVVREQARQQEAERIRRANERHRDQYKALPLMEKEHLLRESLGITGVWPYWLNRVRPEATAIAELPRIWQARLFSRFIFGKGAAVTRLEVNTLHEWVVERFGVVDTRAAEARIEVKQFLGYLRGCGFLEKSPYNPYEADYYKVVHDKLAPPSRPKNGGVTREAPPNSPSPSSLTELPAIIKPHWLWRASWPSKAEMLDTANTLLAASPHKELLLHEIETLSPQRRPNEPLVFALLLERQGIPRRSTLDFLVELGLALKSSRTI